MSATTARTRTARKVIGSLGVIGAAAAVAGLGTFGTFTDSTAPLNATVAPGTLWIDLDPADDTCSLPMAATDVIPGDSPSRSVDLCDDGTANVNGLTLTTTASDATKASLLDTDQVNGLESTVKSCTGPWTTPTATTYACAPAPRTSSPTSPRSGPSACPARPAFPAGNTDHLVVTLALPTGADNAFQGLSSALSPTSAAPERTHHPLTGGPPPIR